MNINSNYIRPVAPVPLKHSINSNFEVDVLESEATAGKKESRLVISDQHIQIDKSSQVRFKSSTLRLRRFTC